MKLSTVRVKTISNTVLATFETAVNDFLATDTQREFIGIQYQFDGATYTCTIVYAE